jgi:hypothetical protein
MKMRWEEHVIIHMGQKTGTYKVMAGKSEGKRSLQKLHCKLEDDIKMECKEKYGKVRTGLIYLVLQTSKRLLNTVINFGVPEDGEFLDQLSREKCLKDFTPCSKLPLVT